MKEPTEAQIKEFREWCGWVNEITKSPSLKEKIALQDIVCKGCLGCSDGCEKLCIAYLEARIDKIQQYWFGSQAFKHEATKEIIALFHDKNEERIEWIKALMKEGILIARPKDLKGIRSRLVEAAKREVEEGVWEHGEVFILKPKCVNFIDKGKLDPDCKAHKMCEYGVHYPYNYCPMSCYEFTGKP